MSNVTVESMPSPQDVIVEAPATKTASEEKASDKPAAAHEHAETKDTSGASEKSEEIHDEENEEEDQEDTTDGEKTTDDGKPKKKNGFKKRIDKLSKRASAAEQEAAYWRDQALKGQNPPAAKVEEKKEAAKSSDGEPKVEDFDTHTEYVKAVTRWEIANAKKAEDAKSSAEKDKSETEGLFKTYGEQIAQLKKVADDFDETLEDVSHVNMPKHVQQFILKSENGAELTYALAKNPKEFERICSLSKDDAARAIGRFEAKLTPQTVETKTPEQKTTKAPAPINPVGSKSTSTSQKNPDDMTQAEFNAWRESQKRKRA